MPHKSGGLSQRISFEQVLQQSIRYLEQQFVVHFLLVGGKGKGSRDTLYLTVYADSNTLQLCVFLPSLSQGNVKTALFLSTYFPPDSRMGKKVLNQFGEPI